FPIGGRRFVLDLGLCRRSEEVMEPNESTRVVVALVEAYPSDPAGRARSRARRRRFMSRACWTRAHEAHRDAHCEKTTTLYGPSWKDALWPIPSAPPPFATVSSVCVLPKSLE